LLLKPYIAYLCYNSSDQTSPGQSGLKEARMKCKALFALSFLGSFCVVGCGGGGGGGSSA
jgi:hypothetical protein